GLPARWLLIRRAVSWAVAEGLLRLNPLAGMRGPPRPLHRRHRGQDRCAASWLPTVTPSRRRMMRSAADRAPRLAPGGRSPPGSRWCWSAWLRTAGTAGRAGGTAAAVGPGRPGPDHRAKPVRGLPGPGQVREDPAGDPRVGV